MRIPTEKMIDLVKNEIKNGGIRGDITEFISKLYFLNSYNINTFHLQMILL